MSSAPGLPLSGLSVSVNLGTQAAEHRLETSEKPHGNLNLVPTQETLTANEKGPRLGDVIRSKLLRETGPGGDLSARSPSPYN